MHRRLVLLAALLLTACPSDPPGEAPDAPEAAPDQAAADPAPAEPPATAEAPAGKTPAMLAASHILVQYQGSMRAPPTITRSKDEALARAKEALAKAADGGDFAALAREYSDGPTGPRGGSLGNFPPDRMIPEFTAAVLTLDVGALAPEPVETSFGYHVIRRDEAVFFGARHILVQYQGSMRAKPEITRSKDEARARAKEALDKAAAGEDFAALAKSYSDGPTGPTGGDLGVFGPGSMVPAFEQAVVAASPHSLVPEPVETPFGFHVIFRTE